MHKHKTLKNIILSIAIVLVLINTLIPSCVYAARINTQQLIKDIEEKTNTKIDNADDFEEFLDVYNSQDAVINENDPDYEQWVQKAGKYYNDYYKNFNSGYEKFTGTKYNTGMGNKTNTSDYTNYLKTKIEKYNEYLKQQGAPEDANGKTQQQVLEENKAELEYVKSIIKNDDEGFLEDGFWESVKQSVEATIFKTICNLATTIADAAVNLAQELMIPCSPTAVATRENGELLKSKLDARDDDSYIISFATLPKTIGGGDDNSADATVTEEKTSVVDVPFIYYSPAAIFSNQIPLFDINFVGQDTQLINPFFKNNQGKYDQSQVNKLKDLIAATEKKTKSLMGTETDNEKEIEQLQAKIDEAATDAQGENKANPATTLQKVVGKWYVALRNLSITGLLIVLIYIGIRITISATSEEQAKYKTMIKDWVMALILIMVLHYIMLFLITIVNIISKALTTTIDFINDPTGGDILMNTIRTEVNHYIRNDNWFTMLGYTILYAVSAWYMIIFTWKFIRRVIYMAFLTMIAPLVALTYPIDKISDGKAQAYNMWLKEYSFNLIIQPVDLLIYTIFVTSAIQLVDLNIIYSLIAMGFILQAEKFIKKMFGLGAEGGAAKGGLATAAAFTAVMSGLGQGTKAVTGAIEDSGKEDENKNTGKIRTADSDAPKGLDAYTYSEPEETSPVTILPHMGGNSDKKTNKIDKTENTNEPEKMSPEKQAQVKTQQIPKLENVSDIPVPETVPENLEPSYKEPNIETKEYNTTRTSILKPIQSSLYTPEEQEKMKQQILQNTQGKKQIIDKPSQYYKKIKLGAGRVRAKYINKNTAKKAGKLALMGAGATTLGMIGLTAGLATGDDKNILKMGAAGVAGGAFLGKEISKQTGVAVQGAKNLKDSYQKGYLGDEYKDKQNEKLDKQWMKSEETKQHFIQKYGEENWKEKLQEALELRKQGITNQNDIDRAIKLKQESEKEGRPLTIAQAGNTIRFVDNVFTRDNYMKEGGEQRLDELLTNYLGDNEEAKAKAKPQIIKLLEQEKAKEENSGEETSKDSDEEE